jgi:hypothetical protein
VKVWPKIFTAKIQTYCLKSSTKNEVSCVTAPACRSCYKILIIRLTVFTTYKHTPSRFNGFPFITILSIISTTVIIAKDAMKMYLVVLKNWLSRRVSSKPHMQIHPCGSSVGRRATHLRPIKPLLKLGEKSTCSNQRRNHRPQWTRR